MTKIISRRKQLKVLRARIEADRDAAFDAALALADRSESDVSALADLEFSLDRIDTLDRRLDRLPKVSKVREPDIYEERGANSFFADLLASVAPWPVRNIQSHEAVERLSRHSQFEWETRREWRSRADASWLRNQFGITVRAAEGLSNLAGAGGEFIPPKWIVDQFASVSRAASPLRRLVRTLPLPDGTLELHIPRLDIASGVVAQNVENTGDSDAIAPPTDSITAEVVTFRGLVHVSQQLYDRGGFDSVATADFAESYAADLQFQMVNGTGSNGEMLGLLNVSTSAVSSQVPGALALTYTDASPTVGKVVQQVGMLAGQQADARDRPPTFVLMRPSRYFWLASTPDSNAVPVMRPGTGLVADDADTGPFGPVAGLPAYLDSTIPNNLGAGANQDVILTVRGQDILLLEAEPTFSALVDTAGGASQLSVVLQYHRYAAAFTSRYPSAIGSLTGTGLVVPTGY